MRKKVIVQFQVVFSLKRQLTRFQLNTTRLLQSTKAKIRISIEEKYRGLLTQCIKQTSWSTRESASVF